MLTILYQALYEKFIKRFFMPEFPTACMLHLSYFYPYYISQSAIEEN